MTQLDNYQRKPGKDRRLAIPTGVRYEFVAGQLTKRVFGNGLHIAHWRSMAIE
jgi:hypothetical protein